MVKLRAVPEACRRPGDGPGSKGALTGPSTEGALRDVALFSGGCHTIKREPDVSRVFRAIAFLHVQDRAIG